MIDSLFDDYLRRTGKRRWCDKSLGSAVALEPFVDLYPKAKFICVYRHCMDVIASGLEASPFGLSGYGFENYSPMFNGNSVAAIAASWCDETAAVLAFEEAHPGQCCRVHYEHLVADPELVAAEVFDFLGVDRAPGISVLCLAADRSYSGPGDHKILGLSHVSQNSVGRGICIPPALMPVSQLRSVNGFLQALGYTPVDQQWDRSVLPPQLIPGRGQAGSPRRHRGMPSGQLDRIGESVAERLRRPRQSPLPGLLAAAVGGKPRVGLCAYGADGEPGMRAWALDTAAGSCEVDECVLAASGVDWIITGDARSWLAVLVGEVNVASSLRSRALRCVEVLPEEPDADRLRPPDEALCTEFLKYYLHLGR